MKWIFAIFLFSYLGWILRSSQDRNNPTLAGGVYGKYITLGKPVYWRFGSPYTYGVILISDGGKYGLDKIDSFEYNGVAWTAGVDYKFHRGTFTKQIEPRAVSDVGVTKITFVDDHDFVVDEPVRLRSINGNIPPPLEMQGNLGQSKIYYVRDLGTNWITLGLTTGAGSDITFTDPGTGSLIIWRADAGFDDPEQGLPTFVPEVETTFNNMAYIEFKKNIGGSGDPPDWTKFRIIGTGNRMMDYDNAGAELGVIEDDDDLLTNTSIEILDNLFVNFKVETARIDFPSWREMREDNDVEIFQRVKTDETAIVNGLSARYFQGDNFTDFKISRLDATVDIPDTLPTVGPAPGVVGYGFSTIWTGQIKPEFTELYNLIVNHDNEIQVWINGNLLIDETSVGTHSATYSFVADQLYDIEIRFRQIQLVATGNHYACQFKWSSPSQAEEIVPSSRLFPSDTVVKRSRCSGAFIGVEASEVHERLMERIPGWDWTDNDGKVFFLAPNRVPVFTFKFDLLDDDSVANFANKTFQKKRRGLPDRKNYLLFMGRDIENTGYPVIYAAGDREELRRFTNGEPSNDDAIDLGLIYRSLMERMAEQQMVWKTDPKHTANLDGGRSASKLRKNQKVRAVYYDRNGNFVVDEEYVITLYSWGASNDRNKFSLLPLPRQFYTDEPVSPED